MPFTIQDAKPAADPPPAGAPASDPGSTAAVPPIGGFTLDAARGRATPAAAGGPDAQQNYARPPDGPGSPPAAAREGPLHRVARIAKAAQETPLRKWPGAIGSTVGGFFLDTLTDVPKEIGAQSAAAWKQLFNDFKESHPDWKRYATAGIVDRLKDDFHSFVAAGKLPVDAFNVVMAPFSGATTALVSRPISKLTTIPESEVDTALFAAAPEKGYRPPTLTVPGLESVRQSWTRNIQPELVSEQSLHADPLFAKYAANRAQMRDQIVHAAQEHIDVWNKVPEDERLRYLLDMESGAASGRAARQAPTKPLRTPERPLDPSDFISHMPGRVRRGEEPASAPLTTIEQKITAPKYGVGDHGAEAERHRRLLDQAFADERRYGSKAAFVEEYFPHIWKDVGKARQAVDTMRATLGPRWFQKARTYDLIIQGLASGLELKSTNPEVLVMHRLLSGADMRARMELLHDLRRQRAAAPVTAFESALPSRGWFSITAPNGEAWLVRDDLAPLWKNAVEARGLWANEGLTGDAFRAWMAFKNAWVPVKLSLSMFHPLHILHINFSNSIARALVTARHGNIGQALRDVVDAFNIFPGEGREARAAWLVPRRQQTPDERAIVDMMVDGGFSPQLSEQLRIAAARQFKDALAQSQWFRLLPAAMRRAVEVMQAPIFETWIPNLKAHAYLSEARAFFGRRPEVWENDVQRRLALRTIAKSIDNRFGEMFYGGLFWNRTIKDAGVALFLSLSWNTGFVREFGGGLVLEPLKKFARQEGDAKLLADVRTKTAFATVYSTTAAIIAGVMTYALSGRAPQGWLDYVFPATGETNPDGSKHRLSTPFFTREIPQEIKHVQSDDSWVWGTADMLYNKLMIQPVVELLQNKDYWGYDIADLNAPVWDQTRQILAWVARDQFEPITMAQSQRSSLSGGGRADLVLSFMGFGPAPSYSSRTYLQNRIEALYGRHVAPPSRPHDDRELADIRRDIRGKLLDAVQHGDNSAFFQAVETAANAGLTRRQLDNMRVPTDIVLFRSLPIPDQLAVLRDANADELRRYAPFARPPVRVKIIPQLQQELRGAAPAGRQ